MALLLRNSIFFHIGRTGGYAIRTTLQNMNITEGEVGSFHCTPSEVTIANEKPTFTFVRHPLIWLRSLWYHKLLFGVDEWDHPLLHHIYDVTPAVFIEYCIENFPGGLAYEYFKPYLTCTHVGRLENLNVDLRKILVECREIDEGQEVLLVRENSSTHNVIREFTAPLALLEAYMATESHWCEKFEYTAIPPSLIGESRYLSSLSGGWSNRLYRETTATHDRKKDEANRQNSASAFLLGCASRSGFTVKDTVAERAMPYDYNDYLLISSDLRENLIYPRRAYENFIISEKLRDLKPAGKRVLQIKCRSGFHALSAERFGATDIIAIDDEEQVFFSDFVIPFLASNITFRRLCFSDIPALWNGSFDVVVISQFQELTSDPRGALAKMIKLLKPGGHLIVDTEIIDEFAGIPLVFYPTKEFSPTGGVAYMNREGLKQALEESGSNCVEWTNSLKIGLDNPQRFPELPFPSQRLDTLHRTSIVTRVLLDVIAN